VRFTEERFADEADLSAGARGFDGGAEAGAAGTDHENVVLERLEVRH
jgi:hypothetical protein